MVGFNTTPMQTNTLTSRIRPLAYDVTQITTLPYTWQPSLKFVSITKWKKKPVHQLFNIISNNYLLWNIINTSNIMKIFAIQLSQCGHCIINIFTYHHIIMKQMVNLLIISFTHFNMTLIGGVHIHLQRNFSFSLFLSTIIPFPNSLEK